jgi:hypothetical protein
VGAATLAALALALALAACGTKPLSANEFRARASAICAAEQLRSRQVARPLSPSDVTSFVAAALRLGKPAVDKLGALRPPDDLKPPFDSALGLLRRRLGLLTDAGKRLREHAEPLALFATLEPKLAPLKLEEARHWQALALPQCAGG